MSRKLRSSALALAAGALLLAGPVPTAAADGLPVIFDGAENAGVPSLEGGLRYSAVTAGGRTVVLKIAAGTGEVLHTSRLEGIWAVPLVAYDSSPGGLSADGRTLTLIEPRLAFPRDRTTLALFDANTLELRDQIELEGDFSFDAISPTGATIYLIEYTDPRDPTAYEVRAYDVERGRLLPDPIVDPNERGEDMAGFPQTRAASPDGRWAYTLYSVPGRHHPPFIHALDTKRATAVCIDLDVLADHRRIDRLSLSPSPDGSTLAINEAGEPRASVDLDTFEVGEAQAPGPPPTPDASGDGADATGWILIGGGLVLAAGAGALVVRRRRRPVGEAELERLVGLDPQEAGDKRGRERDPVG